MKLVILFERLGPYHHARLHAAGKLCDLTSIEFDANDKTYAWDRIEVVNGFKRITLFQINDFGEKSSTDIKQVLWHELDKCSPDVVAIPGWGTPSALLVLAWCSGSKIPAILMSDSQSIDESRVWWKEQIKSIVVGMFSTALVAGSPHVAYAASLGLNQANIYSGYDVVDNAYFSAQADKARVAGPSLNQHHDLPSRFFLTSNRFIEKKNLFRLVDAYAAYVARAGASSWDLVLLGDGPLKSALAQQVVHLGLKDRVIFPGFIQYDDLPVFYGLASAFIHSSTSEQWGLVVNEAMASGLPVLVSTNCGCASDLVKNGVNGYTFDPFDIKSITELMFHISGGDCDLVAMGKASREIISNWSPEVFAEGLMKAAIAALTNPLPRVGWFDRALLWLLIRR